MQVLQRIILAVLVAVLALWCLLPGSFRKCGIGKVQKAKENGIEIEVNSRERGWLKRNIDLARERVKPADI